MIVKKDDETHLRNAYEIVKEMTENLFEMNTTSVELARIWGVDTDFQQERLTLVKQNFNFWWPELRW